MYLPKGVFSAKSGKYGFHFLKLVYARVKLTLI